MSRKVFFFDFSFPLFFQLDSFRFFS